MTDQIDLEEAIAALPAVNTTVRAADALSMLYAGRSAETIRAYRQDMGEFARWIGTDERSAIQEMIASPTGMAHLRVMQWRADMLAAELSPATINRRLSALKSVLKIARTLGLIDWQLEVKGVKSQAYRDTRGPSLSDTEAILAEVRKQDGAMSARNEAMVRLMYDLGLRRGEVSKLDVADVDFDGRRVWVLGKGKTEKEAITLPNPTFVALWRWMEYRGHDTQGPVFVSIDRHGKFHGRLAGGGIWHIVITLAKEAGVKAKPHGFRHASITVGVDKCNGDYRAVLKHSRHAKIETILRYDDNREDKAGQVSAMIAGTLSERE